MNLDALLAINHLFNLFAPAFFMALMMVVSGHLFYRNLARSIGWLLPFAINFAVGCAVIVAGLWFFGNDGKMLTYAALALACATSQWLHLRGWRG